MTITAPETITPTGPVRENRTFRRLLGASSVSMLGSHVTAIAYPLLVLRLTGSAFTAGCAVFAATAPSMCAYIPAGALVDRWSRIWGPRRAMLLSELGRGVAIGIVTLTLALGKPMVALLMTVAVIEGVLEVFSELAERRYVGSLVERDRISAALVRTEARTHVAVVAGRPLGGLLFGISPILPFLVDFFSFGYSVFTLLGINDREMTDEASEEFYSSIPKKNLIGEVKQGLRWIREDKVAGMAIMLFSGGTLIFQALIIVFLGDAQSRQMSAFAIGIVLAASGVGGALGSLVASRRLPKLGMWMLAQTVIWFAGFCFFSIPAGREFLSTAMIMGILGLTGALGNIALDTHVMQNADREVLARVTSVGRLVSFSACSVGPVLGGILTRNLGNQLAMPCLCLFALIPLMFSTVTIFSPEISIRGGYLTAAPEPSLDGGDEPSMSPDGQHEVKQPEPVAEDGASGAEWVPSHPGGESPRRLLAGMATIATLAVIFKPTDR